jgi:hypothetical protein
MGHLINSSHNLQLSMIHRRSPSSQLEEVVESQQLHRNKVAISTSSNHLPKEEMLVRMEVLPLNLSKEEESYLGF